MTQQRRPAALVTGGAVRVGRAISRALAAAGYAVAVNYNGSSRDARALVKRIEAAGGRALALRADITAPGAAAALVGATVEGLGGIDLLVNNAAIFERRPFRELDEAIWERHLRLNLDAPFRLGLAAARHMWESGGGRVVNVCGTVGIHPRGEYAPYCVSKAGLDTLTRCMAEALAPRVQVNGVAPGAILFPEGMPEREKRRVLARVPMKRVGAPEDVAAAVLFFAAAPPYVTGTILPVDGGASLVAG